MKGLTSAHHVAVEYPWKDVHLDVFHPRRYRTIRLQHVGRCPAVLVAPDDANRLTHPVKLLNVIQHPGSVAADAGGVAETLRPEDRVGAAVAEAHGRGASIEVRECA